MNFACGRVVLSSSFAFSGSIPRKFWYESEKTWSSTPLVRRSASANECEYEDCCYTMLNRIRKIINLKRIIWTAAKARHEIFTFWSQIRKLNPYATDKYPNNHTDVNDMIEELTRKGKRRGLDRAIRLHGQSTYEWDTVRRPHYYGHQTSFNNKKFCVENIEAWVIIVCMSTLIVCVLHVLF
jgi:hypothetical protein